MAKPRESSGNALARPGSYFYPPNLRRPKRPEVQPHVTLDDVEVPALQDGDTVRWLGFHLDNKLSFQGHVRIMCARARKAAQCMRMLVNTVRGLRAHDARRLYVACVLPIMTYGAAVWWQGRNRLEPVRNNAELTREVTHRGAVTMLDKLGREQSFALRMVLPVWRTTSTDALMIEAGCMPIEFYLNRILDRTAIRISTLPHNHTLLIRSKAFGIDEGISPAEDNHAQAPPLVLDTTSLATRRRRRYSTRLTTLAQRCAQGIERAQWVRPPWWESVGALAQVEIVGRSSFPADKRDAGRVVQQEVLRRWEEIRVFTDGSRLDDGRTGMGFVIYRGDREVEAQAYSTGRTREVFDAEVCGLLLGFDAAFRYARRGGYHTINIYADNIAAIQAIASGHSSSSLGLVKLLDDRIRFWLRRDPRNRLRISWVPGHVGVTGNERADDLAGIGAHRWGAVLLPATSISYARRRVNELAIQAWQAAWETALAGGSGWYHRVRVASPSQGSPPTLTLARRDLGILLQIRTGHGDFGDYHQRFKHEDAQLWCICGELRTPLHPLGCAVFARHHHLLRDEAGRAFTAEQLLNDKDGVRALIAFSRASHAYERGTYMREDEVD